jgi:Holliday junction resolvase RusA-like endonuclease
MEIQIFGDPAPQGSKRVFNGRIVEAAGNKLKVWRKAIAAACQSQVTEEHSLLLGPVRVVVVFYLPRPASVTIKKRVLPIVPPDLDKLLRGLLDGIGQSEVIWGDDSQVVEVVAKKRYADETKPGASVSIEPYVTI